MSATSSASSTCRAGPRPRSTQSNGSSSTTDPPAARPPTIVFLHGTRLNGASWAAQLAELSDEFHCLAPDLAGHGSAGEIAFTLDGAAQRVAELIAREATDGRAILVGLSLGGYVAMDVAARWPERVRGLVIAGATAEPLGPRSIAYRSLALLLHRVPDRVLDRLNQRYVRWRFAPELAEPIVTAGFSFGAGAIAIRALVGERFRPRLAAYPGPSLLINGEFDLFFRPSERSFAAVAADPRRVLIRRATHLANLDQPAAFSAAVRRFARTIP